MLCVVSDRRVFWCAYDLTYVEIFVIVGDHVGVLEKGKRRQRKKNGINKDERGS